MRVYGKPQEYIGTFETSKEAAVAYDLAALKAGRPRSVGPLGKVPMNTFVGHTWVVRDSVTKTKIQTIVTEKDKHLIVIQ